jgi:hypothetical protein
MSSPEAVSTSEYHGRVDGAVSRLKKPSYRAEREFGLIVGSIIAILGGWWVFRGKYDLLAPAFLSVGILLISLGAAFPKSLVLPNRAWMRLALILSMVSTPVILGLVFFLVITPIGVAKRMFGWDPLRRRGGPESSYWKSYAARQRDRRHYEKMY